MKKLFYTMLLMAVAGMTMTTFVACEENDEEVVKKEEVKEDYVAFEYWVSNDVLEIADVTVTGLNTTLKFNTNASCLDCPGKICDLVELKGQDAKNASFSVEVKLKSNWKELLSGKDEIVCGDTYTLVTDKKDDPTIKAATAIITTLERDGRAGDDFEGAVESRIARMGFDYKK